MRARPDLLTALSFLTLRVNYPIEDDIKKLKRLLSYIRETVGLKLILYVDGTTVLNGGRTHRSLPVRKCVARPAPPCRWERDVCTAWRAYKGAIGAA